MKLGNRILRGLVALLALTLVMSAESGASAAVKGSRGVPSVIYDSDMDFDDVPTLAYLCQEHKQRRINLRAVTVTNNGVGTAGRSLTHARTILRGCGLPNIPVADGSNTGIHPAPPEVREIVETILKDSLGDGATPNFPSLVSASTLIARTVRESPSPVTVLATGPLSNVAAALQEHGVVNKISRLYAMGGAFDVKGNLFGSTVGGFDNTQELNMWIDPGATDQVFASAPKVVRSVPLDATNQVSIRPEYIQHLATEARTFEARLVKSIVTHPEYQSLVNIGALFWWDPLTAVSMVRGGTIVDYKVRKVDVVLDGASSGRTVDSAKGTPQYVGYKADAAKFEQTFLAALNG